MCVSVCLGVCESVNLCVCVSSFFVFEYLLNHSINLHENWNIGRTHRHLSKMPPFSLVVPPGRLGAPSLGFSLSGISSQVFEASQTKIGSRVLLNQESVLGYIVLLWLIPYTHGRH